MASHVGVDCLAARAGADKGAEAEIAAERAIDTHGATERGIARRQNVAIGVLLALAAKARRPNRRVVIGRRGRGRFADDRTRAGRRVGHRDRRYAGKRRLCLIRDGGAGAASEAEHRAARA